MQLKISHNTHYRYDMPVQYSLQQVRLTPKSRDCQKILSWETTIEGGRKELEFDDQHNNRVVLVSVEEGRTELSIHSQGVVETTDTHGVVGEIRGYAPLWFFKRFTPLTTPGPELQKLVNDLGGDFDGDVSRMHALSGLIGKKVTYETGATESETTAEDALGRGQGVCQDHAHIFIAAARLLGFPARYVSGYLMMNDRVEQDAGHAWAEVYLAGVGWVGFDVSNNICPDERYVRVAMGLDYQDAAPISGLRYGDSRESMSVTLQVQQQ